MSCARLRLARPSDALAVREFLEAVSPEETVPSGLVRTFTFVDPRKRLVVAASAAIGGRNRVVGLADVAFTGTGVAELGVVVDERSRNRGVGKLLTEAVASLAIQQGHAPARRAAGVGRSGGEADGAPRPDGADRGGRHRGRLHGATEPRRRAA